MEKPTDRDGLLRIVGIDEECTEEDKTAWEHVTDALRYSMPGGKTVTFSTPPPGEEYYGTSFSEMLERLQKTMAAHKEAWERTMTGKWGEPARARRSASQEEVDAARARGEEVIVRKEIDGRKCVERVPGIWLDDGPNTATEAKANLPLTIHIPRAQLESWQRWKWRLWKRITDAEYKAMTEPEFIWNRTCAAMHDEAETQEQPERQESLIFVKELDNGR